MNDYLVRATAADAQIRAFAITSRQLVEEARRIHQTSPVVTAALGRLLTAGAMMGSMLKGERDTLTIQVKGDGPIGSMTVIADAASRVKGYAASPQVLLPASPAGKLDVGRAVGRGYLSVIKDLGLREPYAGQTELQTGEIAEDLTYYFAVSEQTPSTVGLGVLMERSNTVRQAGGFILQLLPQAREDVIAELEGRVRRIPPVTTMLDEGDSPEQMLERLLGGLGLETLDQTPAAWRCECSRERVERALAGIGEKDLSEMIADGKETEVVCDFCHARYAFSPGQLQELLDRGRKGEP